MEKWVTNNNPRSSKVKQVVAEQFLAINKPRPVRQTRAVLFSPQLAEEEEEGTKRTSLSIPPKGTKSEFFSSPYYLHAVALPRILTILLFLQKRSTLFPATT